MGRQIRILIPILCGFTPLSAGDIVPENEELTPLADGSRTHFLGKVCEFVEPEPEGEAPSKPEPKKGKAAAAAPVVEPEGEAPSKPAE